MTFNRVRGIIILLNHHIMITLRPHQQRGLDALDTNNKGQVIVPTGGGKTLIAIMDAQREVEKKPSTIVVLHGEKQNY